MHYRVLQEARDTRPFEPFDIVMSSGDRYRVAHPENILILKNAVVVPVFDDPADVDSARGDSIVRASYLHIAALEPVKQRASTQT